MTARRPSCPQCAHAWAHCHGSLIVHIDGHVECSEAGCAADVDMHRHGLECAELVNGCGCARDAAEP